MTKTKNDFTTAFERVYRNRSYRFWLLLLGILSLPVVLVAYLVQRKNDGYKKIYEDCLQKLRTEGYYEQELEEARNQTKQKRVYFKTSANTAKDEQADKKIAQKRLEEKATSMAKQIAKTQGEREVNFCKVFTDLMKNPLFWIFSIIVSFPMYLMVLIHQVPALKYISARLIMMVFVVLGVIFFVFTILYFSPMQPAQNLLGDQATPAQIESFNKTYGLDQPYHVRLADAFKDILTFNLGKSYQGNEDIALAIANKFPTTLTLAILSMMVSLAIAIPAGILSAIKQYSSFDYFAMFLALLGLSIPNFWLGLILILTFSINYGILPATFVPGALTSFIMPAIVLGTGMSASVARMTRSSILEVKNSDYILTARAKGLSESKVVFKHILRNALIPIVTVVGLQFGAMLGGSSVTEKVFNISGLGSWIVDKQFIPDIPVVLSGVVYIAVVISIANLIVDLLYTVLDPRIKT